MDVAAKGHNVALVIEIERVRLDIDRALVARELERGERALLALAVLVVLRAGVASLESVFADADCVAIGMRAAPGLGVGVGVEEPPARRRFCRDRRGGRRGRRRCCPRPAPRTRALPRSLTPRPYYPQPPARRLRRRAGVLRMLAPSGRAGCSAADRAGDIRRDVCASAPPARSRRAPALMRRRLINAERSQRCATPLASARCRAAYDLPDLRALFFFGTTTVLV